jgi:error-prone DNA polymerase
MPQPSTEPSTAPSTSALTAPSLPAYTELHCRSNFSFLTGASHPQELVARAMELGYTGLAITDECSVAGVVRAHEEAKRLQEEKGIVFQLLHGASFEVQNSEQGESITPLRLVLIARNRDGWGDLCELITRARLRAAKGSYRIHTQDFDSPKQAPRGLASFADNLALLIPRPEDSEAELKAQAQWVQKNFKHSALALELLLQGDDANRITRVRAAAESSGLPIAAAGDVLMHLRSRKAAQDTLTAIRLNTPVAECGYALQPNAEQHLRSRLRLAKLYRPEWLEETQRLASLCNFTLDELRYEYPQELVPEGRTAIQHLRVLTAEGARRERYPQGVPASVSMQLEREFELIEALHYEAFFLTVHDVVRHARSLGILCQGRGSAANSAVCYCLGITEVDPTQTTLLFERFISRERNEPPDIDVDFEHERREEVIQYIYRKYGTERTALAAALATYRTRSAVRDVGKALALDESQIDAVARSVHWFDDATRLNRSLAEAGLCADAPVVRQWMELIGVLRGFPRHLSQHVGGFVIARDKLSRLVPIENAAMADRRVIQWDKDDLESLGLLKVDVLALGMLTTIRRTLHLMGRWYGRSFSMQDIPREDAATYAMCSRADTVGVFQIESRAQMSMLPRLKPRCLYDLVIEVAIVRPGPIQGGMVHPYLQRREARQRLLDSGKPLPVPQHPALDAALARTLGVPIFQEQVMQICVIAAGFTPGESDQLRRAMAAWRRDGHVDRFETRIKRGMAERGYDSDFADAIFKQICGFGEYGFPESHAFSFALLAYVSAWMKCHEPEAFLAALINSQPMGFYAPAQLLQDARRHGVVVLPVDVMKSDWDCTLEAPSAPDALIPLDKLTHQKRVFFDTSDPCESRLANKKEERSSFRPAVRLGLRLVSTLAQASGRRIEAARVAAPFVDVDDLARRAGLHSRELQALARADALLSLAGHRRSQLWAAAGHELGEALLRDAPVIESALDQPQLSEAPEGEAIVLDYAATGLTLRRHPLALLRERLSRQGWRSAEELAPLRNKTRTRACGIVTMRQQPETAKGVIFVTLEDETGSINVIVWRHVREQHRRALLRSRLLGVHGEWQSSEDGVTHLIAHELEDMTPWLGALSTSSRDFH